MRIQRRLRNAKRVAYAYIVVWPAARVLPLLPKRFIRVFCLWTVSPLMRLVLGNRIRHNLKKAFGDSLDAEQSRRIAHEVTDGTADLLSEWMLALDPRGGGPAFHGRFDDDHDEGRPQLQRILDEHGSGMIGLTGHIGNWELLPTYLNLVVPGAMYGAVAKRMPNPHLNRFVEEGRMKLGTATIYRDESPPSMIRALRKGQMIGVVPDQDSPKIAGTFIDFFGHPAYTPTGPARLALAARVPIVPGFMVRTDRMRFRPYIGEAIVPDPTQPREEEVLRLTRAWSAQVEEFIRRFPGQWAWFHDRWHTTPEHLERRGRKRISRGLAGDETSAGAEPAQGSL